MLDSGFSFRIVIIKITTKLKTIKDTAVQWKIQAVDPITNLKVKIYFTLPEFSLTKVVTWEFHVYNSYKIRYYVIFARYILTALG